MLFAMISLSLILTQMYLAGTCSYRAAQHRSGQYDYR